MEIFNRNQKLNFVDDNNVLLGFDYSHCCCEDFGYWFSTEQPKTMPSGSIDSGEDRFDLNGYNFDTAFFESVETYEYSLNENLAVFKLVKPKNPDLYLALFNVHNGYYSHGFKMSLGREIIQTGDL